MNYLSLFNGLGGGRIALNDLGLPVTNYYASEVDKYANQVASLLFPDTIMLGCVKDLRASDLPPIDFLMGGSPCQDFSMAGKMRGMQTTCKQEVTSLEVYLRLKSEGFEFTGQSYLFWEYVRILRETKPKYFMLENVQRMARKWRDLITAELGVEPCDINSALVSAQNRRRLYWCGVRQTDGSYAAASIPQPDDEGILLRDILETGVPSSYRSQSNTVHPTGGKMATLCAGTHGYSSGHVLVPVALREQRTPEAKAERARVMKETGRDYTPFRAKEFAPRTDGKINCLTATAPERENVVAIPLRDKANTILATIHKENVKSMIQRGKTGLYVAVENTTHQPKVLVNQVGAVNSGGQGDRVYSPEGKSCTLTASSGGTAGGGNLLVVTPTISQTPHGNNKGGIRAIDGKIPTITTSSWEQNNKLVFVEGLEQGRRLHDGKNLSRNYSQGSRVYSADGKATTLTAKPVGGAGGQSGLYKTGEGYSYRKLTVTECLRAQTLPEFEIQLMLISGVSKTQLYKMNGNGWTIKVIAHIIRHMVMV